MAPRANRGRGVSLEHGTRSSTTRTCVPRARPWRLARRGTGRGATAGARLRRRVARALGSHGRGADGAYPSWLEVRLRTETELMGRFVGRVGSVRHVSRYHLSTRAESRSAFPCSTSAARTSCASKARCAAIASKARRSIDHGAKRTLHGDARAGACVVRRRPSGATPVQLFNGRDSTAGRRAARSTRLVGACGAACSRSRRRLRRSRHQRDVPRLSPARGAQVSARAATAASICAAATRCRSKTTPARRSTRCAWAASTASSRRPATRRSRGRRVADARRRARRPARHGRVERHDDHRRPRNPWHYRRRARQRRGRYRGRSCSRAITGRSSSAT